MHIFLVATPLQVLNAIEAVAYYQLESKQTKLVVLLSPRTNAHALTQMRTAIALAHWEDVTWYHQSLDIQLAPRIQSLMWYLKVLNQSTKLKLSLKQSVNTVYVGNYYLEPMVHIANCLNAQKVVILDDGNSTVRIAAERLNGFGAINAKYQIKSFALRAFGMALTPFASVEFFTAYPIRVKEPDSITQCNYPVMRSYLERKEVANVYYLIGSPVVEDGIMDADVYMQYLRDIAQKYGPQNMVYIPHRREGDAHLEVIRNVTGIDIKRSDYCLELLILKGKTRPHSLIGLFSSALFTCARIFGADVRIIAYRVHERDLAAAYRSKITAIYEAMTLEEVISLDIL